MASVTRRLVFYSARCPRRIQPHSIPSQQQWQRPLSSTAARNDEAKGSQGPSQNAAVPDASGKEARGHETSSKKSRSAKPTPEEETAAQLAQLMADLEAMDPQNALEAKRKGDRGMIWGENRKLETEQHFDTSRAKHPPHKLGFWAEGEESLGPDEDYYADDITSHGHSLLEERRDMREYARMIAWELPLLHQLARPFELPSAATPFRFRYTSYLGESHPAANKVVVEFAASDMPNLTQVQKDKLIKLAGPRYNPETDVIKMSCELFDTLPQNKRFLGDTISKLLAEARNPKDTFADVPFDFRHHKPRPRHEFPKEWVMTEERKKYLEEKRQKMLKLDEEKTFNGTLIDGTKIIETSLPFNVPTPEPVMVGVQKGKKKLLR